MPIPDSVMNDFIRNYEPADAAHNYIFKDGTTEYIIFAGVEQADLRKKEKKEKKKFDAFIIKNGLTIPEPYRTNNEDIRFLMTTSWDAQGAYDSMVLHEQYLLNVQV